jgi:hypothetical protein
VRNDSASLNPADCRRKPRLTALALLAEAEFLIAQGDWARSISRLSRAWECAKQVADSPLRACCCLRLSHAHRACGLEHLARCFHQLAITAEMESWQDFNTLASPPSCTNAAIQEAALLFKSARRPINPEWN